MDSPLDTGTEIKVIMSGHKGHMYSGFNSVDNKVLFPQLQVETMQLITAKLQPTVLLRVL